MIEGGNCNSDSQENIDFKKRNEWVRGVIAYADAIDVRLVFEK